MATNDLLRNMTLMDAKALGRLGRDFDSVAEVLSRTNDMFHDAVWVEANGENYHKMLQRTRIPRGQWRKVNDGVNVDASKTREITVGIGMLEAYSEPDKVLVDMSANRMEMRTAEAAAFIEGMAQTVASSMIYANHAEDPEEFSGLAPMLSSLDQDNVVSCGGSGSDLTSIYLVQWDRNKVFMVYPKGSPSFGVERIDLGEQTKVLPNGRQYQVYRDHFRIHCGLAVKDDRAIARVANIETAGASNTLDEDKLIQVLNRMPMRGKDAVIYCNRTMFSQFDILAKDKQNVQYAASDAFGRPLTTFRGIPVKLNEAILDTESEVAQRRAREGGPLPLPHTILIP